MAKKNKPRIDVPPPEQPKADYGVSPEVVEEIKNCLELGNNNRVDSLIKPLHAADIADLVESLDSENRSRFIDIIKLRIDPEFLSFLAEVLTKLFALLSLLRLMDITLILSRLLKL